MNPTKSLSVGAKLLPLLLLLSSIPSWTQQLEVFNPPTSTGNTQAYTDLFSVVLPKATHLNGMTVLIPWGTVDTGESAPCQETAQVKNCDWSAIEQQLLAYINGPNNDGFGLAHYPGTKLNLIIVLVPEAGPNGGYQNVVPQYVFNAGTYSNWCPSCSPRSRRTSSPAPTAEPHGQAILEGRLAAIPTLRPRRTSPAQART
jgi:hypothetical protein